MKFVIGSVLILLLIIGAAGYFYYGMTPNIEQPPQASSTPIASVAIPLPAVTSSPSIPIGWKLYTSEKGFSLAYPADMSTDTMAEGERFYKLGPTQSTGTELYDGISLLVRTGSLGNLSIEELAAQKRQQMKDEPTTQSITEVKPVRYGDHEAFQFRQSSLGEGDFIYFQKSSTEYLEVINLTVEPTNREQTFQKTVETMLATIRF